jgi:streptogramin lyase
VLKVGLLSAAVLATAVALLVCVGSALGAPEGAITEFSVPTAASEPGGIAPGPDGNLWFTEFAGDKIGRITPGGAITEFSLPTPNSRPEGIAPGPDGNVWFTEYKADKIGRITPSGVITEFPVPTPESGPKEIALGSDGNLWFTEIKADKIGRITPNGTITEFPIPTPESEPWGIASYPEGNLWFTEYKGNKIGEITPSGAITEFPPPALGESGSMGIATGPDGDVWFTEFLSDTIWRTPPSGGGGTEFFLYPRPWSFPGAIAAGPDGGLWFTEDSGDKIGRITPDGAITEFPVPTPESKPEDIAPGPDGNLWFTESKGNKIARIGTGAPEALASAPTVTGGEEAGKTETCNATWSTWDSFQPSPSLFGFDGYSWQLGGARIATGQSYTPTVANIGQQLTCIETVTYRLLDVTASASSAPFTVKAPPPPPPPPPTISALRQSASSWREGRAFAQISRRRRKRHPPLGTTFSFALSEPSSVSFSFTEHLTGRRVGHVCVAQGRRNVKHKRCERAMVAGALSLSGSGGANRVVFQGWLEPAKKLSPGRYTLTMIATNFAGGRSAPQSLHFTIVK